MITRLKLKPGQKGTKKLAAEYGDALVFGGAWLRLIQVGAIKVASNPYAGPPPLLTCLFCGGFGIIFGAVASLYKRKR